MTAALAPAPAVTDQREQLHDDAAANLEPVLAALAAGFSVPSLRAAVPTDVNRNTRRAAAADELTRQSSITDTDVAWHETARDAHTAAVLSGAAAAAHTLSDGSLSAAPAASPLPDPFDPAPWVAQQRRGIGGDLADALITDLGDEELLALIEEGDGAYYYLDLAVSRAYLDAASEMYGLAGVTRLAWVTASDERVCSDCEWLAIQGPYYVTSIPDVPHGLCRCSLAPTDEFFAN